MALGHGVTALGNHAGFKNLNAIHVAFAEKIVDYELVTEHEVCIPIDGHKKDDAKVSLEKIAQLQQAICLFQSMENNPSPEEFDEINDQIFGSAQFQDSSKISMKRGSIAIFNKKIAKKMSSKNQLSEIKSDSDSDSD